MSRVVQRNQELLGHAVELLHREWGTSRAVGGSPGQLTCCSMVAVELPELRDHPAEAASAMAVHDVLRDAQGIELPVGFWEGRLWVRLSAQMYNRLEDYVQLARAVRALSNRP
jgi:isopenicillin-N epimerase